MKRTHASQCPWFTVAKTWKHECSLTDEQIKIWRAHLHTQRYWNITQPKKKKDETMPFAATRMALEITILSQKKTNNMVKLICGTEI